MDTQRLPHRPYFHESVFPSARLKIKRALQHINDLYAIFLEFRKGKLHDVIIEHDPGGGDDLLKVRATAVLPDDFVLTMGDAVHNLRTSLDYVINDIEFATTGERTPYTKFPMFETRDALIAAANGGLKQKAPKQVLDCIVHTIQPYKGGNGDALAVLHEIDIEDKHRLLLTKNELNFVTGISIEDDAGIERPIDTWLVVEGKVAQQGISGCRNAKVKNQGEASYTIRFGSSSPFASQPVIPTLHQLAVFVRGTVDEIEYWFRLSQISKNVL